MKDKGERSGHKMQRKEKIAMPVIRRLPRYYRFLTELEADGITRISSRELSERMGLTASQIRQDLNCFGGFGQQGYGYAVHLLRETIGEILGLGSGYKTVLVGAGNLGRAVASHISFDRLGFSLIGIFDRDPALVGHLLNGITIRSTDELEIFCKEKRPEVAILCVPMAAAGEIGRRLIEWGVKSFWNFSHYDFSSEFPEVLVENVHMNDSLMTLCYRLSEKRRQSEEN